MTMMKYMRNKVLIRLYGNSKMYAPKTPAMAPLAPIVGTWLSVLIATWAQVAATPQVS